jgi:hypothetical protein
MRAPQSDTSIDECDVASFMTDESDVAPAATVTVANNDTKRIFFFMP